MDGALKRCEGNFIRADYLLNTDYFNYFYRISRYNKYVEDINAKLKPQGDKNEQND